MKNFESFTFSLQLPYNIKGRLQNIKILSVSFSPAICHLQYLRIKNSPSSSVLGWRQSV
jgi:hypothetical protein